MDDPFLDIPITAHDYRQHETTDRKAAFAAFLRAKPTASEVVFKLLLRELGFHEHFIFQEPMFGYIPDFYCPRGRFIIEVDGSSHDSKKARIADRYRDRVFRSQGIETYRFRNEQVISQQGYVKRRLTVIMREHKVLGSR